METGPLDNGHVPSILARFDLGSIELVSERVGNVQHHLAGYTLLDRLWVLLTGGASARSVDLDRLHRAPLHPSTPPSPTSCRQIALLTRADWRARGHRVIVDRPSSTTGF